MAICQYFYMYTTQPHPPFRMYSLAAHPDTLLSGKNKTAGHPRRLFVYPRK